MCCAPDQRSALKDNFDRLCIAYEQAGVEKPATMADVFPVADARLKSQQEMPPHVDLVKSRAERVAALSAQCKYLEGTITERKSSATQLREALSALQTQAANIQALVAACADAGASAAGRVQELEGSVLSAENDLCTVQARQSTPRAKKTQLLDICKALRDSWGSRRRISYCSSEVGGSNVAVRWCAWERE